MRTRGFFVCERARSGCFQNQIPRAGTIRIALDEEDDGWPDEPKVLLSDVAKILLWSRRRQWEDKLFEGSGVTMNKFSNEFFHNLNVNFACTFFFGE